MSEIIDNPESVQENPEVAEESVKVNPEATEETNTEKTDWRKEYFKLRDTKEATVKEEKQVINKESTSVEETVLRMGGASKEEISLLKDIAALKNLSLVEAKQHEFYKDWKAKQEAKEKSKAASLPTSKFGGKFKGKSNNEPGLTMKERIARTKALIAENSR